MVIICICVEYVCARVRACVKFGRNNASGYGHLSKTTQGGSFFMGHHVEMLLKQATNRK